MLARASTHNVLPLVVKFCFLFTQYIFYREVIKCAFLDARLLHVFKCQSSKPREHDFRIEYVFCINM